LEVQFVVVAVVILVLTGLATVWRARFRSPLEAILRKAPG